MAGLEVQVEDQKQLEELVQTRLLDVNNKANNRSKICHWSSEDKVLSALLSRGEHETNSANKKGGIVRSRSFHTVEEYDAMVEKIWHSNSMSNHPKTVPVLGTEQLQHSNSLKKSHYAGHSNDAADIQENAPIIERTLVSDKIGFLSTSGQYVEEDVVSDQESKSMLCTMKGLKRKAIAKGLRGSLEIPPTTIEFPSMRSMRKCGVHVNEVPLVYFSGDYVTPKFGSYNSGLPNLAANSAGAGQDCSNREESMLNPELVVAFEEGSFIQKGDPKTIMSDDDHGTICAALAAGKAVKVNAVKVDGYGICRSGLPSARIAIYRVGNTATSLFKALMDAVHDRVDVISVSMFVEYRDKSFDEDFSKSDIGLGTYLATMKGIPCCASAGNHDERYTNLANIETNCMASQARPLKLGEKLSGDRLYRWGILWGALVSSVLTLLLQTESIMAIGSGETSQMRKQNVLDVLGFGSGVIDPTKAKDPVLHVVMIMGLKAMHDDFLCIY
ncbi:hypothetical protein RJ640_005068 [Escallonia rubra]|uniref:Peptidase S8/S53 domain-containing protein n=1 Tax=Escallonia rubra TaxID=112253 RepID=A0AA88QLC2_9ASTE|nr:hypothetical protein RJ640_005068 [Escallonia rubra]